MRHLARAARNVIIRIAGQAPWRQRALDENLTYRETPGNMNNISELSERHIAQLHSLYQGEWWTRGRSLEDTRRCVRGSQICIGITSESDDLIGFVRVLTDFTFKAILFDVIVAPSERGKGLGHDLLTLARNHERLQSVRHIELYCLPEMSAFYEKHGFSVDVGDVRLMRLIHA